MSAFSCRVMKRSNNDYTDKSNKMPDYNDLSYWAAHPLKKDLSDSISNVYAGEINLDLCDVFYLHPTTFTDKRTSHIQHAQIDDSVINQKTDASAMLYQASVFNEVGRIYAPRYRQAHIYRYFDTGSSSIKAFDTAYADIKKAFSVYLEKWNNGRPLIIASHSQGTTHAIRLVKEMIDGTPLGDRIVLMYLLGMPVKKNDFVHLKPCSDSNNIHCFYSWRTYKKGYDDKFTDANREDVVVTNPVDKTSNRKGKNRHLKKEAILWNYNKGFKMTHDTWVMGDMLWINRPKFKGSVLTLFMKNYHAGDINLFYGDIRARVKNSCIEYYK